MADQKISSSRSDKEDFGTMANNVRTKIQTYFSQLIEVIKLRRTKLISELDEIIYRKRQEEKKINELEKINIFPCEMYSSSIVKDVQDDVISRIGPQLANLRKNHSLILEFEWNQKFAREASGLGKLKTNDYLSPSSSLSSNILPVSDNLHNSNASNSNSSNDNIPTSHVKSNSYHSSLNQSKIASNSKPNGNKISVTLFQSDFPKELQELITLRTDIGIIPRDCLELKTFTSKFSHYPNWSADIKGCYNCGTFTLNELNNKYFCRLRCYLIFYEWCRVKVQSVTKIQFCQYPGCPKKASDGFKCCNRDHTTNIGEMYRANKIDDTERRSKISPKWYKKFGSPNQLVPHLATQCTPTQTPTPIHNPVSQQQAQQFQQTQQYPMQYNNEQNLLFCLQLTQYLYYETDIGPIPRGIRFFTPSVNESNNNWSAYIDKCYWCCSRPPDIHLIACSMKCFFLLNEWLHNIYESSSNKPLCKSIGCTSPRSYGYNCCKPDHSVVYDSSFKEYYPSLKDTEFALGPIWYTDYNRKQIEFYNREDPFYEFTNFYPCDNLILNNLKWKTSEHYFQAMKFYGTPYFLYVNNMNSPRDTFEFSRAPEGRKWVHPHWHSVKIQVMLNVLRAKFSLDSFFGKILLRTGDAVLVEHTKNDKFWRDGGDGSGENRLGNLLMQVRTELRQISNMRVSYPQNQMPQNNPIQPNFSQQPCGLYDPMATCAQNGSAPPHDMLKQNVTQSTQLICPTAPIQSPPLVASTNASNSNLPQKAVSTNPFEHPNPKKASNSTLPQKALPTNPFEHPNPFQTDNSRDGSSGQSPQQLNSEPLFQSTSSGQDINSLSNERTNPDVPTIYSMKFDLPPDYWCPFSDDNNDNHTSMDPSPVENLCPNMKDVSDKPGENSQCKNYNPFSPINDVLQVNESSNPEIDQTSDSISDPVTDMEADHPETNSVVTNPSDSSESNTQLFSARQGQPNTGSLNPIAADLKNPKLGNKYASNNSDKHIEEYNGFELLQSLTPNNRL